jgi:diguanylate cyclase (GGDEF)-like protein
MKVLVVDDNKTILKVVGECVRSLGHEVIYAEDGTQALQCVIDNALDLDLVLMDVEMPGLNGFETTQAIRKMEDIEWFPIIFISERTDDDSFTNGILAGGDAYLPKPINPLRLQLTIVAMERIYSMRKKLQAAQKDLIIANKTLKKISLSDKLTGISNRRDFDETLEIQFKLAKRNKSPLSLIICDIDYFKKYNDSYGHQKGDECLATIAKILASIPIRPTDKVSRYGGEEFTVILPGTDLQGGLHVSERLRQAVITAQIEHKSSEIASHVTLSIGIATYTGQLCSPDNLFEAADEALYRAKGNGRNRTESY